MRFVVFNSLGVVRFVALNFLGYTPWDQLLVCSFNTAAAWRAVSCLRFMVQRDNAGGACRDHAQDVAAPDIPAYVLVT
jgi:hypothetical protein